MIKKILKWTGIILLALITCVTIITASRQHLTYDAPYPDIHASKDTAVIARGRHFVYGLAHCIDCHNTANADSLIAAGKEVPLSGGYAFDLPLGTVYSRNITPDKETGIGGRTDGEIARVLRYGVHANGEAVYDFMPFHNMSDEDLTAVISYIRSMPPVKNKVPENKLNLIGNAVKAYMVKPVGPNGEVPVSVKRDTSAAYGKYLVLSVGECAGCHTKRDLSGAYVAPFLSGGGPMNGGLVPPNLTNDPSGRIYTWTQHQFIERFRKGKLISQSEMPWNSFGRMSDNELKAIYNYLKSVPGEKTPELASK
jgi:mono/diheme cytochrome c family protein